MASAGENQPGSTADLRFVSPISMASILLSVASILASNSVHAVAGSIGSCYGPFKRKRQERCKILRSIKENFERAGMKASTGTKVTSSWLVYNDYKVERVNGDLFVSAVVPPLPSEVDDFWGGDTDELLTDLSAGHYYFPLWDYPDLFVRFARLLPTSEPLTEEEMLEIVLGWVKSYGVLGVERVDSPGYYGEQRSWRRESVAAFAREARRAARTLDAFEAISSDNSPDRMREYYKRHTPGLAASSLRKMEDRLAAYVRMQIDEYISRDCYPRFELTPGPSPLSQHFSDGWGFRSLLGAMYLQMRHYALEPGMLRRCKADDCDRIVAFEPGTPPKSFEKGARGKYRTRADKVYCGKACGQRMRDRKKKDLNS